MRITEGLSTKDKQAIIRWTNSKDAYFLQQWAGDALPHCFRIEVEGSFIGMIQQIRVEGSNVHIGRFLINPSLTRKGLGTSAMQLFIAMLFEDKRVHSISLNVFDDNLIAKGLYTKLGFKVVATVEGKRKKYKMVKSNLAIS